MMQLGTMKHSPRFIYVTVKFVTVSVYQAITANSQLHLHRGIPSLVQSFSVSSIWSEAMSPEVQNKVLQEYLVQAAIVHLDKSKQPLAHGETHLPLL